MVFKMSVSFLGQPMGFALVICGELTMISEYWFYKATSYKSVSSLNFILKSTASVVFQGSKNLELLTPNLLTFSFTTTIRPTK